MKPTRLYQILGHDEFMAMYNNNTGHKTIETPKYSSDKFAHITHDDGVRRSYKQYGNAWEYYAAH